MAAPGTHLRRDGCRACVTGSRRHHNNQLAEHLRSPCVPTPAHVSCLGQTREVVNKNQAILLLGVMTLLLAAADVWALVQMRRHRTTFWVQFSGALLALTTILSLNTLTAWWSFRSLVY